LFVIPHPEPSRTGEESAVAVVLVVAVALVVADAIAVAFLFVILSAAKNPCILLRLCSCCQLPFLL
jgi:hypothetical protein